MKSNRCILIWPNKLTLDPPVPLKALLFALFLGNAYLSSINPIMNHQYAFLVINYDGIYDTMLPHVSFSWVSNKFLRNFFHSCSSPQKIYPRHYKNGIMTINENKAHKISICNNIQNFNIVYEKIHFSTPSQNFLFLPKTYFSPGISSQKVSPLADPFAKSWFLHKILERNDTIKKHNLFVVLICYKSYLSSFVYSECLHFCGTDNIII